MIIAFVQFHLPQAISVAQAREIFSSTAPKYLGMPGLLRKAYILSEDGRTAGGMYWWVSREAAERLYSPDWQAFVAGKYGALPVISYFESPVQVDNQSRQICSD